MLKLKQPFPFFLNNDKENFWLIIGVSVFTYLFLVAFKPFGSDAATPPEQIRYTLICFMVMCFNLLLLPRIAVRWLDSSNFTLGKYISFNLYNLLTISLAISISNVIDGSFMAANNPLGRLFLVDLSHVMMQGIIPLVVITFISHDRLLLRAIRSGSTATEILRQYKVRATTPNLESIIINSDTKEILEMKRSSFMYAHAENNYTEIFWKDDETISNKLLRLPLKSMEDQIGNTYIMRCHRSYLVNLKMVDSISGNANGYRLHMSPNDAYIPVSRSLGKEILERINQLAIL